jgi:hypothetical protein
MEGDANTITAEEYVWILKEALMVYFKLLLQYYPRRKKNHIHDN